MRCGTLSRLVVGALVLSGCASDATRVLKDITGIPPPNESRPTGETRWVLIQNLRFIAEMAEPEYIWVEEDRIPGTLTTAIFGRRAALAPQHLVAQHGPPPEGGLISPLQGGPPLASRAGTIPTAGPPSLLQSERDLAERGALPASPPQVAVRTPGAPAAAPRGYVIHVQAGLVVVDLTAADGIKKGSLLSVRRGGTPLTHRVTKEYLEQLEENEIATARVIELQPRFSVAEIQEIQAGTEPKVKDRVVVKQP